MKASRGKTRSSGLNVMKEKSVGEELIESLNEIIAWARGADVPVRVTHVTVSTPDVRAIRKRLKLSQTNFAERFGFALASVRNWEQGRTRPDGAARVLLAVIAKHPEAVEEAVQDLHRAA